MAKLIDKPFINIVLGAVAGSLVEGTGIIDYGLKQVGAYYSYDIRDAQGVYILGVGTGDVLNTAIGVLLKYYAKKKDKVRLNDIADGYICGIIGAKMGELYPYIMAQYGMTPTRYRTRTPTAPSQLRRPATPTTRTLGKYVVTA